MRASMNNAAFWIAAQTGLATLGEGMPGSAKSQSMYAFGRATKRPVVTVIGALRDPADIGGYPYPITVDGETYMAMIPAKWARDASAGGFTIFFDELKSVMPAVQSAMLRVLAEKVVGDTVLPDDTWLVAAANPPEQAANGQELEPPMANRLVHLKWESPVEDWKRGMMNGLNFPEPTFPILPADWRSGLHSTCSLIAAFHDHARGRLEAFPKDREQQSGPWPSLRSWTAAGTCLAAAQSVNAGLGVEFTLVEGCVGTAAATEFASWRQNLDLKDPEELLAAAIKALKRKSTDMEYEHPDRPDKVIATLGSVVGAVLADMSTERWDAGMLVIQCAAREELDVALACVGNLARAVPKGHSLPKHFVEELYPKIQEVLVN